MFGINRATANFIQPTVFRARFVVSAARRICLVLFSLVCFPISVSALDPNKSATQYVLDTWQDELPQSTVTSICQTRDGYLWFGTYEGLVRFDGVAFTVFNKTKTKDFPVSGVYSLWEDRQNRLWIGTLGDGLWRLDRQGFRGYGEREGVPTASIVTVRQDRGGDVWFSTSRGLFRLRDERAQRVEFPNEANATDWIELAAEPDGTIWAFLKGNPPRRWNGTAFVAVPDLSVDSDIKFFGSDARGTIWIVTRKTAYRLRNGATAATALPSDFGFELSGCPLEDRDGNLWLPTFGGLGRPVNGRTELLTTAAGLTQNPARALFEDREGNLWAGTNAGLNRLRDGKFVMFTAAQGLSSENLRVVCRDEAGDVWLGGENGLNRLHDGTVIERFFDGPTGKSVRALCVDRAGTLWVGTGGGAAKLTNGKPVPLTFPTLAGTDVNAIIEDSKGRMWFGTSKFGLVCLDGANLRTFSVPDGLPHYNVRGIYEDRRGTLWVATTDGLASYADGRFRVWTASDGFRSQRVFAFHEDSDGTLWIGTASGLHRLRDGRMTAYTTRDGLFDDTAFCILEAPDGYFWLSCGRGIYRVRRADLDAYDRRTIARVPCEAFDKGDGLKSNQCNGASQPAGWKAADGRFWFPTLRGAAVIDPVRIKRNPVPPPVLVEGMTADGQSLDLSKPVVVEPGVEKFEFHYTATSFTAPERVRFKVKLDGQDREWSEELTRRTAFYTNLAPGEYAFRVSACNEDGVWTQTPAEFRFRLKAPWWKTWWAVLLGLTAISSGVYGSVRLRLRLLESQNRTLETKVAERTAELAQAVAETERKNDQLAQAKREVDEKNSALNEKLHELAEKNAELLASHRRADRIFSALAEALPGTVLDGKYRLDEKIGAGGFGAVFRATHLGLNRPIAVKVFRPTPGNDSPEALERFRREGVSATRINHPNAVVILDSGISSDGIVYLVMELLDGRSLAEEIAQKGRLSVRRCLRILDPVCRVLAEAHGAGIVHRDIKPDNIFLHRTRDGEVVKVVDFGIAKMMEGSGETDLRGLTGTGNLIGTPAYMSPERFNGKPYDGKSDVYSLGVTVFEMLSGRTPFGTTTGNVVELIMQHLTETPPSLRAYNPALPPEIEATVMRALEKDPDGRPTMSEFGEELTRLAADFPDEPEATEAESAVRLDQVETEAFSRPVHELETLEVNLRSTE